MVPIVEEAILKEMKLAGYEAMMHDGWSKFGTLYIALFMQYNRQTSHHVGRMKKATITPTSILLVVHHMLSVPVDDEDDKKEEDEKQAEDTTSFTSEVHAKFFKNVFCSYNVELKEWTVCHMGSCFTTLVALTNRNK